MVSEAAAVAPDEFHNFLQDIFVKTAKQLEVVQPGPAVLDPLVHAQLRQREEHSKRQAASQLRLAAMDDRFRKAPPNSEKSWRETISERKTIERKRRALEAAQALEEAERFEQLQQLVDDSPLSAARGMWAGEVHAREEARSSAAAAHTVAEDHWLQSEWEPLLTKHRQQVRARRASEEEQKRHEVDRVAAALTWERQAMAREDAATMSYVQFADTESNNRASTAVTSSVIDAMNAVLKCRASEAQWTNEHEEQRIRAEQIAAKQEAELKETDYREWRQQVRSSRCRRQRSAERNSPERPLAEQRQLELQGRDWFREHEFQQKHVLDSSLQQAEAQVQRMKERGGSPRRALEEARALADQQRRVRDETEPVKVEQELWETLLAKNRLSRQQERSSRTPRWGVFVGSSP